MYPAYSSKGVNNPRPQGSNEGSYKNPKLDELLEQGRTVGDKAQRLRIYTEIQKILEDELPNFWFYAGVNIEAVRNHVKGYVPSFTGRRIFLKQTWADR